MGGAGVGDVLDFGLANTRHRHGGAVDFAAHRAGLVFVSGD